MKVKNLKNIVMSGLVSLGCMPIVDEDPNTEPRSSSVFATDVYLAESPLNNPEKALGVPDGDAVFIPYSQNNPRRLILEFDHNIGNVIALYSGL